MKNTTFCNWLIVCVLAQGLPFHVASAAETTRESPSAPSPSRTLSPPASQGTFLSRSALPDDGPRYDRIVEGPEFIQFQQAAEAFARGQYAVAHAGFDTLATLDSDSALVPPLKAFLAELTLLEDQTDHGRTAAIFQYRALISLSPKDMNASRARWRVGDLYVEMKWFQEAVVSYEDASAHALSPSDADRSLLGLGVTLESIGRWTEAERAFDTVRKRATDNRLLMRATLGQANALYAQHRKRDALPLYDVLYRGGPDFIKTDPYQLQQYGDVLFDAGQLERARDVDALLYNLYPSHEHAGTAIVRLGDGHHRLGQRKHAELFYRVAQEQYAGTPAAVVAQMRLAHMEDERAATTIEGPLQHKIESMIRGMGDSSPESSENVNVYQSIAKAYQGDVLGSEALFHLAEHYELQGDSARAIQIYQDVTRRAGVIQDDPWALTAGLHLTSILNPQLEAALKGKKDVLAVTLFHSHGHAPEQHYIGTRTLLEVADTHRRLGFSSQAIRLYQTLVRNRKAAALHEEALLGLGESYLDQLDPAAARNVFESFRLQYPRSARTTLVSQQLTTAMLEQGDRQSAIRVMRQWLRLHPRDAARGWIYVTLARTLAEEQKRTEAAAAFEDALRNNVLRAPQDLLLYADLLMSLNKPERAVDLYRQALKAGPGLAEAEWARAQIMLNPEAENRKGPRPTVMVAEEEFDDPLLHRAAAAMQIGLRATMEKEGG